MDDERQQKISVNVPVAAIAVAIVLIIAAAVYSLSDRSDDLGTKAGERAKQGRGMGKKLGLMTFVSLLENDATRKVVIAMIKVLAKRS